MPLGPTHVEENVSQLARAYEQLARLFSAQPAATRQFLVVQAEALAAALREPGRGIRFRLPESIVSAGGRTLELPPAWRHRTAGSLLDFFTRPAKLDGLIQTLSRLERDHDPAVGASAELLRYTLARTMLYDLLPEGQPVRYRAEEGDDIPSIPADEEGAFAPVLVAVGAGTGELEPAPSSRRGPQVRFGSAAGRFYLPQWVAFDEDGRLLAGSAEQAEACVAAMHDYCRILQDAAAICPSLVTDETYQRKRAGMLGQIVNQGRALARYYTAEIITKVQRRGEQGRLDRGLRLSLPYFDETDLAMKLHEIEVIPGGRVMFVPVFVARAMQLEAQRVMRSLDITLSTRRQLLSLLATIELAFDPYAPKD